MKLILISLSLIASFCLGYFLKSTPLEVIKEKEFVIKEVEKEVTKKVYVEDQEEILKAKGYYEKAFKLFLANVGFSLNKKSQDEFHEMLSNPSEYSEKEETQIAREFEFIASNDFKALVKKLDGDLKSVTDDQLVKKAQTFILKDPSLFFVRSEFIKKFNDIKKMNGTYNGTLYRVAGVHKGRVDQIYLEADFVIKEDNQIDGGSTLKMMNEDNVYSNSRNTGGNGSIRFKGNDIVIGAGPNNFFHFKNGELTEANFYTNGKFVGMARFSKHN